MVMNIVLNRIWKSFSARITLYLTAFNQYSSKNAFSSKTGVGSWEGLQRLNKMCRFSGL